MRISDWSSDVCSSDLLTPDTAARMDAAGVTFLPISRVNDEVGSNTYSSENTVWHAFLGLKGDLGTSWKWDAYYQFGQTKGVQSNSNARLEQRFKDSIDAVRAPAGLPGIPEGTIICRATRSEERRVGKGGVSTCRSRWSPCHYKKKTE